MRYLLFILFFISSVLYAVPEGTTNQCACGVTPYPTNLPNSHFYKKQCYTRNGLMIKTSQRVSDAALNRTAFLMSQVTQFVPAAVIARMNSYRFSQAVMAVYPLEKTTDIPEHAYLANTPEGKAYWDERARGLGAIPGNPTGSNAEENVMCLPNDRYLGKDITIHEFAHSLHLTGLRDVYPTFDTELQTLFARVKTRVPNPWPPGHYAMTNYIEYWAEAVMSYYNANQGTGPNTREALMSRDPEMYQFILRYLGAGTWRRTC